MSSTPIPTASHHPLLVLAAVIGAALPATLLTWLANSLSKEGPLYSSLHLGVLTVASATGIGMYLLQLRLDPNVPKFALLPAALVGFGSSVVALVVACVWFLQ